MEKTLRTLFCLVGIVAGIGLNAQQVPTPDHVVVMVMENHGYNQIVGSANAPYLNSLIADSFGALFTNSHGMTHPSQPNYMYLFSGDNQNVILDFTPASFLLPFTSANLGAELLQNGKTFVGYSESLPSVGYTGDNSGQYYRKHNPWVNWQNSTTNGIPAALNQPFTSFPSNFDSLPTLSFVVPNQDHDMHDGTVAQGDAWIQANMNAYAQWCKAHNSLLIITYDEDENQTGSNLIPTLIIGQMVKHGQYNEFVDHNRMLRTMEDMYGLPYAGGSSSSTPITDCWVFKPESKLGAMPVSICPGETVSFIDSTTNIPTSTQWIFDGGTPPTSMASAPVVSYSASGSYNVTLISSNQMGADTLVKTAYITVNPIPVVSLSNDSLAICYGDTINVTANGASVYSWLPASNIISSSGNLLKANPTTDASYQVIGLQNGCVSDTATVAVKVDTLVPVSVILLPSTDTIVCSGSSISFTTMAVNGGNNPVYQWKVNGSNVGSNSAGFSTIALGTAFNVSCVLTSSATCASPRVKSTGSVQVTVEQFTQPNVTVVDSVLTSTAAFSYQWYLGAQAIAGADSQSYTATVSGLYKVQTFTEHGCMAYSNPVTVNVVPNGINQLLNTGLIVSPNPSKGQFSVANQQFETTECVVKLFDLTGRLIYEERIRPAGKQFTLNLPKVQEGGAYEMFVTQKEKIWSSRVLIDF